MEKSIEKNKVLEKLQDFWLYTKRVFRLLGTMKVSLIMVILVYFFFFNVDQVKDAVIAFANFAEPQKYIFFSFICILWASLLWYWARIFLFLEYSDEDPEGKGAFLKFLFDNLPPLTGAAGLLIPGIAFLVHVNSYKTAVAGGESLGVLGWIFIILSVVFFIAARFYCRFIHFKKGHMTTHSGPDGFVSFSQLSAAAKRFMQVTTILEALVFLFILIFPEITTDIIGDSISVLIGCFSALIIIFYWVHYLSRRMKLPAFLILFIWIIFCSFFNGNKDILFVPVAADSGKNISTESTLDTGAAPDTAGEIADKLNKVVELAGEIPEPDTDVDKRKILMTINNMISTYKSFEDSKMKPSDFYGEKQSNSFNRPLLTDYFDGWKQKREAGGDKKKIPMIIVLSEGGGIRAAYWSAGLLSYLTEKIKDFKSHLFCIQGVSGGSFGAAVYAGLLKDIHLPAYRQELARKIIGKDYLSPILGALFTRQILQAVIPVPIMEFDYAKVFENYWVIQWKKYVSDNTGGLNRLAAGFGSLWSGESTGDLPVLFLNTTRVENGIPVTISPLKLSSKGTQNNGSKKIGNPGITEDFYYFSMNREISLITAASLSARFPYMGPAGTMIKSDGDVKELVGLVDGGYFDNSGANLAHNIFMEIKSHLDKDKSSGDPTHSVFRDKIKPIVIYIKNGTTTADSKPAFDGPFYQITAPPVTLLQIRDSNSTNDLINIEEFVNMYDGEFLTFSLNLSDAPLGWSLSATTQDEIDEKIEGVSIHENFKRLEGLFQKAQ